MLLPQQFTHLTRLIHIIVSQYFAPLSSLLIVHNSTQETTTLQLAYLEAVQLALRNLSQPILLQWINVAKLPQDATQPNSLEWQVLAAVNSSVTEGFITILPQTAQFLHARYFATRNANVRLKDKLYLFLCEHEDPRVLLSLEILQFYPHHLMLRPGEPANKGYARSGKAIRTGVEVGVGVGVGVVEATASLPHPHRDINLGLWTQKFVGASGNLDAQLLDAFLPNETFVNQPHAQSQHQLYPNKLLNLQRRTLRLGSITYVPYTVTNYVAAGTGNEDPINPHGANRSVAYDGSEAKIMSTFCEVHNCHLRVEAYGADNWGAIYENESAHGMLGDIYKQRVELAIGCIYNWYDGITETSHTIARSAVTIIGPAPAFDRFGTRFFLATLLCATITLENIYSGQLKSLLTVPLYDAPVDTIEKWAQVKWKWAAPSIVWVHTVEKSDLDAEQILADKFEVRDYNFLYNASFRPNYGLAIERLASGAFNFGNYVTSQAVENRIVLRDDLYFDWTRAVSIRGWALMPQLNRHIRSCQEAGLYVHWELEHVVKYLDRNTGQILFNQAIGYVPKKAPKPLVVDDISAALFVLAFGLSIAGCALLVELLQHGCMQFGRN
ncbi:GH14149 [Drosophila grimshawi]|uniref:GH14149 n=1 Tax=Drosophila grimshawi TaxID=7222 RepID=B4JXU8_DROGR|nr:GH14149 [Drosophila grimshawi]